MSPTQRSLKKLRSEGYTAWIVEKWVPNSPAGFKGPILRVDVWGFGDILAVKVGEPGATLVQTTSGSNASARIRKIQGIAEAGIWLAAGNRITVHAWAKRGARGARKLWDCREVPMLAPMAEAPLPDGAPAIAALVEKSTSFFDPMD